MFYLYLIKSKSKVLPEPLAPWAALISDLLALRQTLAEAARPWTRDQCVARCACVLPSLHCSTKLYCLVTEARVCEQLAQGRTRQCSSWDRNCDLQSQVQCPNHYATGLQLCLCNKDAVLYLKIADDALWGESKLTLTGSHITETPSSQLNTIQSVRIPIRDDDDDDDGIDDDNILVCFG